MLETQEFEWGQGKEKKQENLIEDAELSQLSSQSCNCVYVYWESKLREKKIYQKSPSPLTPLLFHSFDAHFRLQPRLKGHSPVHCCFWISVIREQTEWCAVRKTTTGSDIQQGGLIYSKEQSNTFVGLVPQDSEKKLEYYPKWSSVMVSWLFICIMHHNILPWQGNQAKPWQAAIIYESSFVGLDSIHLQSCF